MHAPPVRIFGSGAVVHGVAVGIVPDSRKDLQLENRIVRGQGHNDMLAHMKRTTLILDAGIYAELKRRAAHEGRTLTEIVEHALRAGLHAGPGRHARVVLPSFDLGPFLVDV